MDRLKAYIQPMVDVQLWHYHLCYPIQLHRLGWPRVEVATHVYTNTSGYIRMGEARICRLSLSCEHMVSLSQALIFLSFPLQSYVDLIIEGVALVIVGIHWLMLICICEGHSDEYMHEWMNKQTSWWKWNLYRSKPTQA